MGQCGEFCKTVPARLIRSVVSLSRKEITFVSRIPLTVNLLGNCPAAWSLMSS